MSTHEEPRSDKSIGYVLVWCLLGMIRVGGASVAGVVYRCQHQRQRLSAELDDVRDELKTIDPIRRHYAYAYQGRTTHMELIAAAEAELRSLEATAVSGGPSGTIGRTDTPDRAATLRAEIAERRAAITRLEALRWSGVHERVQRLKHREAELERQIDALPW